MSSHLRQLWLISTKLNSLQQESRLVQCSPDTGGDVRRVLKLPSILVVSDSPVVNNGRASRQGGALPDFDKTRFPLNKDVTKSDSWKENSKFVKLKVFPNFEQWSFSFPSLTKIRRDLRSSYQPVSRSDYQPVQPICEEGGETVLKELLQGKLLLPTAFEFCLNSFAASPGARWSTWASSWIGAPYLEVGYQHWAVSTSI